MKKTGIMMCSILLLTKIAKNLGVQIPFEVLQTTGRVGHDE